MKAKKLHKVTVRLSEDVWNRLQALTARATQQEQRFVSSNEAVIRLVKSAKKLPGR